MKDYRLRFFRHSGLALAVREYSKPPVLSSARTFVLVHGIGTSARYFARLSRALGAHGTVYAIDLPGFGAAPRPVTAVSIDDLADILLAFTRDYALVNPVMIGHSMGTQVVIEAMLQQPELSDRLVLIAPVIDPRAPTAVRQGLRLLRDFITEPLSANWIVATDYLRCGPWWYARVLPAMLTFPIEERSARLQSETLVIRGNRDPVSTADLARRLAATIPRSQLVEIPGASHVVQHAASTSVAAAVIAHLTPAPHDLGLESER